MRSTKMVGQIFGCLEILSKIDKGWRFKVKCVSCGTIQEMAGENIKRHAKTNAKGCSVCYWPSFKHGVSDHRCYNVWEGMIRRCYNSKHTYYHRYGGRGITVCDEWKDAPKDFIEWLLNNGWRKGLQIDRIDNNKGYYPNNCRIVPRIINQNNTCQNRYVYVYGENLTISEAARKYQIGKTTIKERLNRGWNGNHVVKPVGERIFAHG